MMIFPNMRFFLYRLKRKVPIHIDTMVSPLVRAQDTLVITGFWRSGTTWLQRVLSDYLKAKTIFEPFEVDVLQRYNCLEDWGFPAIPKLYLRTHMPFGESVIPPQSNLYHLLLDAMKGRIVGKRVRSNRAQISDALRTKVIVKLVRGQLIIRGLHNTFSNTIVHIYRDPRAVIASIIRDDWGGEWLGHLSLVDELLQTNDQRRFFFEMWTEEIKKYDQTDWIERVAAYWALTEKYVEHCHSVYRIPDLMVSYESLVGNDGTQFASLLEALPSREIAHPRASLMEDSPTTVSGRQKISREKRLFGWKQELSPDAIQKIADIAVHFDLTGRLYNG